MANVKLGNIEVSEPDSFKSRTITEFETIITFELDKEEIGEQTLNVTVHFVEDTASGEERVFSQILVQDQKVRIPDLSTDENRKKLLTILQQEIKDLFPDEDEKVIGQLAKNILKGVEDKLKEEEIFYG